MFLWLLHTVDLACPHARRMLLPSRILKQNGTQLPYRAIPRRTAPYRTRSHAPFSATDGSRPRVVGRARRPDSGPQSLECQRSGSAEDFAVTRILANGVRTLDEAALGAI